VPIHTADRGVFGARGGVSRVSGMSADTASHVTVGGIDEQLHTVGLVSMHGALQYGLGGSNHGFEGALGLAVAVGPRVPLSRTQGLALRLGARGLIRGDDLLYGSFIEAPRGELGWQIGNGPRVFEIGALTGLALAGRFRVEDATRDLGLGFAWGGYVAAQTEWMRLGAMLEILPTKRAQEDRVAALDTFACVLGSVLSLCGDLRGMRGPQANAQVTAWTAGVTIGLRVRQ
jgi:hypothetical protein